MPSQVQVSFRDYDGDRQTTSIPVSDSSLTAERQDLADGLQVWSIGANDGYVEAIEREAATGVSATSPVAQKSTQLIVEMEDSVTGRIYRERIPMPDLTMADDAASNPAWVKAGGVTIANPAHENYNLYLKTPFETAWVSPAGNAGVLNRAYVEE